MENQRRILERIEDERVFSAKVSEDKNWLVLEERCDQCFEIKLNKNEAYHLLCELGNLINKMDGLINN